MADARVRRLLTSVALVLALVLIVVIGLVLRWPWVREGFMALAVLAERLRIGTEILVISSLAMLVVLTLIVYLALSALESLRAGRAAHPGA
jgi:hypothetical protein